MSPQVTHLTPPERIAAVLAHPELCDAETTCRGEMQPCGKSAVAVAIDEEIGRAHV